MKYFDELQRSMTWLAQQPKTMFLGQACEVAGVFMHNTLQNVPMGQRLEMPVSEDFQMQFSVGLALEGIVPVSIFPRYNFLLLTLSTLVNFLDKIKDMSDDEINPKVIIRTSVGPTKPIHPGHQHVGDYTDSIRGMLKNVQLIRLDESSDVFPAYQRAYNEPGSFILCEVGDNYNDK